MTFFDQTVLLILLITTVKIDLYRVD